jgi:hypothetical protein
MLRSILAACIVLMCAVLAAIAAVPVKTAKDLKKESTHIAVGKVTEIYFSEPEKNGESSIRRIVAQIKIEKVEKGTGPVEGELVYARYWESQWQGKGSFPPPDATMHFSPAPKVGDQIRVYLGKNVENGMGKQTDGGYNVLLPNGFEILK